MDLIKVLDMTEGEQCEWLSEHFAKEYNKTEEWGLYWGAVCDILVSNAFPSRKVILADLAFRLRDEVVKLPNYESKWNEALRLVCKQMGTYIGKDEWFVDYAKPIHWVIASLIAQKLAKETQ